MLNGLNGLDEETLDLVLNSLNDFAQRNLPPEGSPSWPN